MKLKSTFYLFILTLAHSLATPVQAEGWSITLPGAGLVKLNTRGVPVVSADWRWWGKDWAWADLDSRNRSEDETLKGEVEGMGVSVEGRVDKSEQTFQWNYTFQVDKTLNDAIGGGIEWSLNLKHPALGSGVSKPVLLPDNRGWRWEPSPGNQVEVRFEPALADVYFSGSNSDEIRTMFYSNAIEAGTKTFTMKISLPNRVKIKPTDQSRYPPKDLKAWPKNLFAWDQSPVDLSFLNHKPAGSKGPVQVAGDQLVYGDGTRARFWGVNLAAYSLFETWNENIPLQARRLAAMGVNLVRIHHHDSVWTTNVFRNDNERISNTRKLNAKNMDKLDRWMAALKAEGIYLWLDLHVGREALPGDDIDHFAELSAKHGDEDYRGRRAQFQGYAYVNTSIQDRMEEFAEQYLSHFNPYTETTYGREPAVMGLLITNENDITHHFGNRLLKSSNVPEHHAWFRKKASEFAKRTGIAPHEAMRTWEPGPSKLFLNDLEHQVNVRFIEHLKTLSDKPYATTNLWGGNPAFSLPALSDSTIMDTHAYGTSEELSRNPRYRAGYLTQTALGHLPDRPLAISEWNVENRAADRRDRFTVPVFTAAISALQDWDAPMLYGYALGELNGPRKLSSWGVYNDASVMGIMPAAALIFRQQHVSPSNQQYHLQLDNDQLFNSEIKSWTSATLRTLLEQSRITVGWDKVDELPWLKPVNAPAGAKVLRDPNLYFVADADKEVVSDNSQIRRDWEKGVQIIDTPKSQVANGWIGGQELSTGNVQFNLKTPKAIVAVQALDSMPIDQSRRILISAVARVYGTGKYREGPFAHEPVSGSLTIKTSQKLTLRPLGTDGKPGKPVEMTITDGAYSIELPETMTTHWWLLSDE